MKKASLRKSIATAILLLVLAFSATAINTPLVKADAGGIGKRLTIEIVGEGSVTAKRSRAGVTFYFYPELGYHVSAIKIDGDFISKEDSDFTSYTFPKDNNDHRIVVFFSADGEAYVPAGTNVFLDLGGNVGLYLESTEGGDIATQASIDLPPRLVGTSLILWDVYIGVSFDGIAEIALPYLGTETITHVFHSDLENLESAMDALYSDVNADGVVDGDDVSDVANAIKSYTGHGEYDAYCDVDRDGENDEDDIHLVNEYKGTSLQSLDFDVVGNTLYIYTELNRVFRGR